MIYEFCAEDQRYQRATGTMNNAISTLFITVSILWANSFKCDNR